MNKTELTEAVYQSESVQHGFYTRKDVDTIVSAMVEVMISQLRGQSNISINHLGKLYVTKKRPYVAVSNLKGTRVKQSCRLLIRFKPSKKLSRELNCRHQNVD